MNMIEVDPKLFITCRLCLDEMGLYQIVPKVQMQIKYCFEIDVQPFDGLPQLICKKCESILSQYAGIKQMYQVKQKTLKTTKKSAQEIPEETFEEIKDKNTIQQQQDTVSSTQQVESVHASSSSVRKTNKQLLSLTKKVRSVTCESSNKSNDCPTPTKPTSTKDPAIHKVINKPKREKFTWASNYTKQFVCRFCSIYLTEKKSMISHLKKHEDLIIKYSSVFNNHCEIRINKVGSTQNLTNSVKNVVLSERKIIHSANSKYYILYTSNTNKESSSEESSDEELARKVGKYKRQRLMSVDSIKSSSSMEKDNSQTSIDVEEHSQVNNIVDCNDQKSDGLIDCVTIDSDSTSTKVSDTEKPQQKLLCVNKKLMDNIINMCYNKYLKRFDNSKSASKQHGNMDSFLQHKVLSIGTKIIHSKGLNSIGLLRYLEHKNLDISWTQTKHSNSPIIVQPSLVNVKSSDNDINLGWKSLNELDLNHTTQDFVDIFEKVTTHESSSAIEHREVIVEPSQLDSNENNIEKEISTNISPITLNEKNKTREKKSSNSYNPLQSTDVLTEPSENAVLLLRTDLESDKQTCNKILNASPVPYPKQLPTKKSSAHESSSLLKSPTHASVPMEAQRLEATFVNFNNEVAHMPVITSAVSLASPAEDPKQKQSNSTTSQVTPSNISETNLPQIKVKPISELMPDRRLQNNASLVNMAGWTVTSANKSEGIVLHANNANLVYVANVPQYASVANVPQYTSVANVPQYTSVANVPQYTSVTNVPQYTSVTPQQSAAICYPQVLRSISQDNAREADISRQSNSNERTHRKNPEFVHMHTVDLPNNKTTSPFRYFQKLLQIHDLVLLESTAGVSYISTMKCLIKFSLGFQQENNAPVSLCLTLYCDKNIFCIKVRDNTSKDIDVSKLSANWQWEILKVFKGDIVNKLNLNALKHGLEMSSKVNYFVSLLKAIIFSKEK